MLVGGTPYIESATALSDKLHETTIFHGCHLFFRLLVNGFSVTSFHPFSKTPYCHCSGRRYRLVGRN